MNYKVKEVMVLNDIEPDITKFDINEEIEDNNTRIIELLNPNGNDGSDFSIILRKSPEVKIDFKYSESFCVSDIRLEFEDGVRLGILIGHLYSETKSNTIDIEDKIKEAYNNAKNYNIGNNLAKDRWSVNL